MAKRVRRCGFLLCLTTVGMLFLFGCRTEALPPSMIGVWVTPHERYRNCEFSVSATQLVFAQAGEGSNYFWIQDIAVRSDNEKKVVTIAYTDANDGSFESQWVFSPRNGGVLWHTSQPEIVWRRQSGVNK